MNSLTSTRISITTICCTSSRGKICCNNWRWWSIARWLRKTSTSRHNYSMNETSTRNWTQICSSTPSDSPQCNVDNTKEKITSMLTIFREIWNWPRHSMTKRNLSVCSSFTRLLTVSFWKTRLSWQMSSSGRRMNLIHSRQTNWSRLPYRKSGAHSAKVSPSHQSSIWIIRWRSSLLAGRISSRSSPDWWWMMTCWSILKMCSMSVIFRAVNHAVSIVIGWIKHHPNRHLRHDIWMFGDPARFATRVTRCQDTWINSTRAWDNARQRKRTLGALVRRTSRRLSLLRNSSISS